MPKLKYKLSVLFVFLILVIRSYSHPDLLTLTVIVKGAVAQHGSAMLAIFNSADRFLKEPLLSRTMAVDDRGEVTFRLNSLSTGRYAVSIIYDENNDGELNTGFFGYPKELVGFSNNAKGTFGPPSFEKASFLLSKSKTIQVVLDTAKN